MGDESIPKKQEVEFDKNKVLIRRIAGIMSMVVGIPNLLAGILLTLSGIGAVIALVVMLLELRNTDTSDELCGPIIIALLIILVIVLLIAAVIFTVVAFFFAIGVAGQALGGFYGFRGLRYTRTIVLTLIGSLVSLLAGIGLLVAGIFMKDAETWVKVTAVISGCYEIFAFLVTMAGFVLFIITKNTFVEPEKRQKKKKKKKGKGPKEKKRHNKNEKEDEDDESDWGD